MLIHKKIKLDYKNLFKNFGKMLVAGILTFVLCFYIGLWINSTIELPKYVFEGVKIAVITLLCIGVYSGLNLLFKMEYARELVNRIKK